MAGAGYRDWVAGDVPTAVQFDTFLQEQTVMVFASAAARDTALSIVKAEGMLCYLVDTNVFTVYSGAVWSTFGQAHSHLPSYTPSVVQSASVTSTNGFSRVTRIGPLVFGWFSVAITGTGTASNMITVTAPITAWNTAPGSIVGSFEFTDASVPNKYAGALALETSTTFSLRHASSFAENRLGMGTSVFTAALASGDLILGSFHYEAATDA